MTAKLRVVGNESAARALRPDYTYEGWVHDLQGIVWNEFKSGRMTLEDMAEKAMLQVATVERFAWGKTKKPHAKTAFELSKVVGFPLPRLKGAEQAHPTLEELRERAAR